MVSGVLNGDALDKDAVTWCTRITRGKITTVVAGPQVFLKASFTLDHSKKPHAIDYMKPRTHQRRRRPLVHNVAAREEVRRN